MQQRKTTPGRAMYNRCGGVGASRVRAHSHYAWIYGCVCLSVWGSGTCAQGHCPRAAGGPLVELGKWRRQRRRRRGGCSPTKSAPAPSRRISPPRPSKTTTSRVRSVPSPRAGSAGAGACLRAECCAKRVGDASARRKLRVSTSPVPRGRRHQPRGDHRHPAVAEDAGAAGCGEKVVGGGRAGRLYARGLR